MTKVLTQRTVETLKPPKKGRCSKADGIVPGSGSSCTPAARGASG